MNKIKDIFGKLTRPLRIWHKWRMDSPEMQSAAEAIDARRNFREKQVASRANHIYINNGLNRHERRKLEAQIRTGSAVYQKGRFKVLRQNLTGTMIRFAKFQLRETPINVPATYTRLVVNSFKRKAGEPILVYSLQGRRA